MTANAPAATNDPLLDELNGALARTQEPTQLDRPGAQPPALADALETVVPAAKPAPRAALLDKTLSKKAGGHGYRVIVEGTYYAKSAEVKGNVVKNYVLPFNLPALLNSKGEAALGIIVGKLLKDALQKMDPLAITFRTHSIKSVVPLAGAPEPTSLQYMSFESLKEYVRKNISDFPVDVDEYVSVEHLREDVIDFKINATSDVIIDPGTQGEHAVKGGFGVKKTPSERISERHAARKEEAELRAMNEGI